MYISKWHTFSRMKTQLQFPSSNSPIEVNTSSVGIRGMALKWFISYLTNRQQQVTTAEGLSFPSPCTRGVPQGSVLGPLLVSLHIRDAPDVFSTESQLFADDIDFYTANPSLSNVVSTLNNDLDKLDQYLSGKGLLLNPSKTRFIVLRKPCHQLWKQSRLTITSLWKMWSHSL